MRILSWNIQWGRGADGRVDLARTIALIRECGPLDAICLQEVACNWPGLKGMDAPQDGPALLARAFPEHQAIYAPGLEGSDGRGGLRGFGNLMLLAVPPSQVFRRLLPAPCDPDARSLQRMCLEVVVAAGGRSMRILTTHLEYFSLRQRVAQVEALKLMQRDALEEARQARSARPESLFGAPGRPAAAVLCGDLNFAPDSAEYRALTGAEAGEALWCDAWAAARPVEPHAPTVGLHGAEWPDHPYCCDYFLVSPGLAGSVRSIDVLAATDASDHQPVLLELAD